MNVSDGRRAARKMASPDQHLASGGSLLSTHWLMWLGNELNTGTVGAGPLATTIAGDSSAENATGKRVPWVADRRGLTQPISAS
jgi:hypothetical protein